MNDEEILKLFHSVSKSMQTSIIKILIVTSELNIDKDRLLEEMEEGKCSSLE